MSVIFGTCLTDKASVDESSLSRMAEATRRYGIDGTYISCAGQIGMGFQAFHTHARSRLEHQPPADALGNMVVLDGRIDNHEDLAASEGLRRENVSDSELVLKVFERFGDGCFSRIVGDWALALWCAKDSTLYLARDHAGSRTLFYQSLPERFIWSTYLESFVSGEAALELDKEYLARYLAFQHLPDLSPYKGVCAVPPAHYLALRRGRVVVRPHWHWIANTTLRYKSDAEYDEHFLDLFGRAVERRTGPGAPILAELSGGMDSSSIVCMADSIYAKRAGLANQLETISYFDDSEPDWNERPYFTAVEHSRKKTGLHLDCSTQHLAYEPLPVTDHFYPYVGGDAASLHRAAQFDDSVRDGQFRVILSGLGGDELLGGVPTSLPELANHLRAGKLVTLICRTTYWCIPTRQPILHTLYSALVFTANLYRTRKSDRISLPEWLSPELRDISVCPPFRRENLRELLPALPSAISHGRAWWGILDTLPHLSPSLLGCYEYRYPYLDRDLVDFLHRIPREQLIQPGRRRYLMRRALRHIVPAEILERKRKARISRSPITNLRAAQHDIERLFADSLAAEHGLIDKDRFLAALRTELTGQMKWIAHLTRAIKVELWLRSLAAKPVELTVANPVNHIPQTSPPTYIGRPRSA
jgi:asparagine synthase (glutamine-hydrolysing)